MKAAVDWIASNLGWYYVLTMTLVIGAVVLTILATTSGVDRGIRWISELNLWSAVAITSPAA